MPNNTSIYGSGVTSGNVSSSNYTTLYSGGGSNVPAGDNVIITGTLTVNGCSILTDCNAFNLLPFNATTVNAFGAATAVSIGGATGVTTIQNQLSTANYLFPLADGLANQVLTTDGNGILSFTDVGSLDTNYTIDASTATGGANFNLQGSDGTTDTIKFASGTGITVSRTDNSTITITNTESNINYNIDASATTGGANFNLTGSDASIDTIKFAEGSGMSVVRTNANVITFANTSPGTTYTQNFSNTTGGTNLNLVGSDLTTDTVKFANGTGLTVVYTDPNTATLNNTGVLSLTTNTGLSTNTSATGNVSITNTGVLSLTTNTGLSSNVSATGAVTITNTGVTSAVAGTGVSVSAATGAVTFSIGQSVATSASPIFAGATLNGNLTMNGATSGSVVLSVPAVSGSSTMIIPSGNDNLVARNTTDTLTNKTISGVNNTITGIGNASLVNSSITLGTTTTALGATSSTLAGLTSVTVTQDPVANLELATKQYVDTKASTGITYHEPVQAATTASLASITGGTVTYNNGTAGVGATITLSVALTVLDGYTLLNTNRILVKNETNQTYNGIYTWATGGTVLTRATDADTYGSNPNQLSLNDYFFTQNGTINKGIAYVLNAPVGTITFGTSNITFAEFSTSQVYTATAPIVITGTDISLSTVPISLGGTGEITATAAINALMPSQSGNANSVLTTDGTNLAWTDFTGGFAVGNITIAVETDNTISTTAGNLVLNSATALIEMSQDVSINSDTLFLGNGSSYGSVTTNGGSLYFNTNNYTNSGQMFLESGVNGNIVLQPYATGTGKVKTYNDFVVNDSDFYVDTTNNRVGINTATPLQELSVNHGGDGYCQIGMENAERIWLVTNNDGDDLISYSVVPLPGGSAINRLQFNATTGHQWFPTGNLGVNNTNPGVELDVTGSGAFSGDVAVNGGDITTTSATATLFNTTATAIDIGRMTGSTFSTANEIRLGTNGITYNTEIGGLLSQNNLTTQATSQFVNQTSTSPILIMSTLKRSMKGMITIVDNVTGDIHTLEFIAMRKTSTADAWITIFGEMFSNTSLATFTVTDTGTSLYLFATKANSNSTDISITRNSLGN